eukprot:scaffold162830_cov52-Attheya_sp.AAC.2
MPEARQKFREARINLKRSITVTKNVCHEKRAEEVHDMKFDPKTAWLAIREIQAGFVRHHTTQSDMKMRKEDDELARSDSENADVMARHFEKVFNNHRPIDLSVLD